MEPVPTETSSLDTPSTEIQKSMEPKKSNTIMIVVVALFILMALGIIAFLYYQNQQLKGILIKYQATPNPTSVATPTPNPDVPKVSSPSANMKIKSPLTVKGTVPAGWMFEGTFPIKLLDSKGATLAQVAADEDVPGSWQNDGPVSFTATLTFKVASGSGTLVLQNDNPSGLPTNLKTFEIPVNF